jgi:hypothetical protein
MPFVASHKFLDQKRQDKRKIIQDLRENFKNIEEARSISFGQLKNLGACINEVLQILPCRLR